MEFGVWTGQLKGGSMGVSSTTCHAGSIGELWISAITRQCCAMFTACLLRETVSEEQEGQLLFHAHYAVSLDGIPIHCGY